MPTPDDRLRKALVRLVLPGVSPKHLRLVTQTEDMDAMRDLLRHIADQLDGPLAEAWLGSIRAAGGFASYHEWPEGEAAALRALDDLTGEESSGRAR